jgi:hypothetical protein
MRLSKAFLVRIGEQALISFLLAFGGVLTTSENVGKAALLGALAAGGRAVYGVLVRNVGAEDRPEVL